MSRAVWDVNDVSGFHLMRLPREDELGAARNNVVDLIEGMRVFVNLETRLDPDLAGADVSGSARVVGDQHGVTHSAVRRFQHRRISNTPNNLPTISHVLFPPGQPTG